MSTATTMVGGAPAATKDRYKWELLAMLCMVFFLHQADRAIFGVVLSDIMKDLNLAQSQVGLIGTIFFVVMAAMMPVAGYVGDSCNRKWVIIGALICWSAATLCTGFAGGVIGLILLRSVATGGAEAFYTPSAYPLIASYHQQTRTLAMSIHQTTLYIAMMTSGLVAGYIGQKLGWRAAFTIFGGAGLVLGVFLMFRMRPAPVVTRTVKEKLGPVTALKLLVKTRTAALITAGYLAVVLQFNAYVVWAPVFLQDKFGLSMTKAGSLAMSSVYLAAMGGVLLGGLWSDRMVKHRPGFRLELDAGAMILCVPAILLVAFAPTLVLTCAGMVMLGLCQGFYQANTPAALFDVIAPRFRSSVLSVQVMTVYLLGSTAPWIFGHLCEAFGNTRGASIGFAALAVTYTAGSIAALVARVFTFQRDRYVEAPEGA